MDALKLTAIASVNGKDRGKAKSQAKKKYAESFCNDGFHQDINVYDEPETQNPQNDEDEEDFDWK